MQQTDNNRQQATAELAAREQELADARKKVGRPERDRNGDDPQPATSGLTAGDKELIADARRMIERGRRHKDEDEGHTMLLAGSAVAAIAGIGLITAAMLALTVDTAHLTTAGIVAAISAGTMLAVLWVGFTANWYRKHSKPVENETPAATNGSRSNRSPSKVSPSKS
jgi:hypothetical protein